MKVYLYATSGHNYGLERIRRIAPIAKALKKYDPILCTADYRAATYATNVLKAGKAAGIDVLTNLPHTMERGDFFIFDSDEASETTKEYMKEFCTLLFEMGSDVALPIIDSEFYNESVEKTIQKVIFYGNDDYSDTLISLSQNAAKTDIPLLMGFYMFFGNEDKLAHAFSNIIDEEEYIETIPAVKYLLSGSEQAVFESIASGGCPVLLKRADKSYENLDFIRSLNVPVVSGDSLDEIIVGFEEAIKEYPKIKRDIFDEGKAAIDKVANEISKFEKIMEAANRTMDY